MTVGPDISVGLRTALSVFVEFGPGVLAEVGVNVGVSASDVSGYVLVEIDAGVEVGVQVDSGVQVGTGVKVGSGVQVGSTIGFRAGVDNTSAIQLTDRVATHPIARLVNIAFSLKNN